MAGTFELGDPRRKVERVIRATQGNHEHIDAELETYAQAINLLVKALDEVVDFINDELGTDINADETAVDSTVLSGIATDVQGALEELDKALIALPVGVHMLAGGEDGADGQPGPPGADGAAVGGGSNAFAFFIS